MNGTLYSENRKYISNTQKLPNAHLEDIKAQHPNKSAMTTFVW